MSEWLAIIKPGRVLVEVSGRDPVALYQALQFTRRKLPRKVRRRLRSLLSIF